MSFLKRLSRLFSPPTAGDEHAYWIYVRCSRCGEAVRARVDMRNDLSVSYGESDSANTYFTRKTLIGEQRCYQPIEVELTFDHNRRLIDQQIKGGTFITEEEYQAQD